VKQLKFDLKKINNGPLQVDELWARAVEKWS